MEEYMYLPSVTLRYKYSNNKKAVTVKYDIKNLTSVSGTKVSGKLSKKTFTISGMNTYKYIIKLVVPKSCFYKDC